MYELNLSVSRVNRPSLSREVTAVYLFCLLGLAISAAILPMYEANDVFWALVHAG